MLVLVDDDALILLLLHKFCHLLLDAHLGQSNFAVLNQEDGDLPLVLPVVVGGLILKFEYIFLLHQNITDLPIELYVVLLLPQLV